MKAEINNFGSSADQVCTNPTTRGVTGVELTAGRRFTEWIFGNRTRQNRRPITENHPKMKTFTEETRLA